MPTTVSPLSTASLLADTECIVLSAFVAYPEQRDAVRAAPISTTVREICRLVERDPGNAWTAVERKFGRPWADLVADVQRLGAYVAEVNVVHHLRQLAQLVNDDIADAHLRAKLTRRAGRTGRLFARH